MTFEDMFCVVICVSCAIALVPIAFYLLMLTLSIVWIIILVPFNFLYIYCNELYKLITGKD